MLRKVIFVPVAVAIVLAAAKAAIVEEPMPIRGRSTGMKLAMLTGRPDQDD